MDDDGLGGEWAPDGFEDDITDLRPEAAVTDWLITAVGRRPIDFLARDLLLGSLHRDPRPRTFEYWAHDPQYWVEPLIAKLPSQDRVQAQQYLALHYLHARQLSPLIPDALTRAEGGEPREYNLLRRLWRCWPYGVQVEPRDPDSRTERDVCGLAWLCPWCFARKVVALYQNLDRMLRTPGKNSYLVSCRVQVPSDAVPLDEKLVNNALAARILDPDNTWFISNGATNFRRVLSRPQVNFVRDEVGSELRSWAQARGIDGGLLVYQVGPGLTYDSKVSFTHELTLLGEVQLTSDRRHKEFHKALGSIGLYPYLPKGRLPVYSSWMPTTHPLALRLLLAGSSVSYPMYHLPLQTTAQRPAYMRKARGIRGVFALQPTFMFDDFQWWSYVRHLKQRQLYRTFGSWTEKLTTVAVDPFASDDGKMPIGLEEANRTKQRDKETHRQQLLERVRPLWDQHTREQLTQQPHLGRPAVKEPLVRILKTLNLEASERDVRYLTRSLLSA